MNRIARKLGSHVVACAYGTLVLAGCSENASPNDLFTIPDPDAPTGAAPVTPGGGRDPVLGDDGDDAGPTDDRPGDVVPPPGVTAGTLDLSFGASGKLVVTTPVGAAFVTTTADARLVAASDNGDFVIDRYLAVGGAKDTTFGASGRVVTDVGGNADHARTAVFQSDGKMIIGGQCSNGVRLVFCLARYHASGIADSTFESDGKIMTYVPYDSGVTALGIHPDGRIVAAGTLDDALVGTAQRWAVTRYRAAGVLDPTLDGDGILSFDFPGATPGVPRSVIANADGSILVAGGIVPNATPPRSRMVVFRFGSNGARDVGFGTNGRVIVESGTQSHEARTMLVQPDGKILVAGNNAGAVGGIVRLNVNGTVDTTYGVGGSVHDLPDATWKSALMRSDGKLLVAGYVTSFGTRDFVVARVTSDGKPDPTFGSGGWVRTDFGGLNDEPDQMIVTAANKLLVVGRDPGAKRVMAAQYQL